MTVDYIENKVIGTMKKLFAWIVLWSILHFIKTGEIYDLWKQLLAGLASDGILPVSWFLFTYSFLLFLGYPLWYLKNKYRKLFGIAMTIFIILRRVIIMVSGSIVCGWQEGFGYVHYLI